MTCHACSLQPSRRPDSNSAQRREHAALLNEHAIARQKSGDRLRAWRAWCFKSVESIYLLNALLGDASPPVWGNILPYEPVLKESSHLHTSSAVGAASTSTSHTSLVWRIPAVYILLYFSSHDATIARARLSKAVRVWTFRLTVRRTYTQTPIVCTRKHHPS